MATFVAGPNIPRPRDFIFGDSPLDVYRDTIQAGLALRKAREPSVAEQKAKQQAIDWVKFRVSKFTEMITKPDIDSASRDHIKMMALEFHGSLPPMFKKAVEPILAYSPLDPVAQGMERFERLNPRPVKPYAMKQVGSAPTGYPGPSGSDPGAGTWTEVRDQGNRSAFAEYDWAMAEWRMRREMMKNKLLGLDQKSPNLKMPRLMHTDDPNIFSYKDDVTQGIGLIDLGKVPKGEVTKAIDEFGDTWPDIIHNGFYRTSEPAKMEIGNVHHEVSIVRDLLKGNIHIRAIPIGPTASGVGKGRKAPDQDFVEGLAGANIDAKPKDARSFQQAEIIRELRDIGEGNWKKDLEGGSQEKLRLLNERMAANYGYTIVPHNAKVAESWWNLLPGIEIIKMQDGMKWMAVPVDSRAGLVHYTDRKGNPLTLFYNEQIEMGVDADGMPVESTKNVRIGGVIDDEIDSSPPPKGFKAEAKARNITIRDVLNITARQAKDPKFAGGAEKAERLVERMSQTYGESEIPGVEFWNQMKAIAEELKLPVQFLGYVMNETFIQTPKDLINAFLDIKVGEFEEGSF